MPKFLNLVSQSGKQEFVDIKDFNKNPNAYGKYKIRMVDDSSGKNYDIPATMFGQAQQDGLRPWNMEKTATAKPQSNTSQPSSRNAAPTPSYQDMISGDYWSKQLGAKPKQDILPTQNKVGLDLPNFGKQDEYVNRTADVLYNEQQKYAKSEEEAKRIQAQLAEANKRAEALKKQIAQERTTSYTPYGMQVGQINADSAAAKKLEQEQNVIAKLSAQLNENEYFKKNLQRLEGVASDLESQASKEILAQEQNQSWLSALTTGRDVMRGTYGIQHNEKMNQASAIRENVRETRRLLREASLNNDSFYNKLGRGLRDAFLDINTWDMGVNSVRNSATTLLAKNNLDKDKGTISDNAVLESAALKNATSQKTRDAISAWYNAGITTTNMIPFMAYIYSSPFNNIGRGLSSSISKMLTQNVRGALLQRMLPQVVYRASINGVKGIGRFAGDVLGGSATALTFANQNIFSDALNRYQGQHTGQFTPDGRFEYTGSQNAKEIGRSFAEAFATQAIEYQSELVGEYFTPLTRLLGKGFGKAVGYGTKEMFDAAGNKITSRFFGLPGHKISLDKTVDLFSRLTNKECWGAWNKFMKVTKQNGVIGEYLEEVVGNMENATLGINDANWGTGEGGVFNPEENMETFLAVAVGTGFMSGLGGVAGAIHKGEISRAYNRANADGIRAFNLEAWQSIRDQIDNCPVPELPTIVVNLMDGMNDNQKRVIQNYAAFSVAKQGSLMADFKEQLEKPHIARVGTSVEISADGTEKYFVMSMDEQNGLLSTKEFRSEEDANAYKARVEEYINNGRNVQVLNQLLSTDEGLKSAEQIAADMGEPISYISELFYLDPLKRTDTEQAIFDEFVSRANNVAFPPTDVNENHEVQNGQDIAEGTEIGDQQAIDTINQREANAISAWNEIDDPDLKNFVTTLTENGSTPNQIVEWLRYYEYPEDVIAAFCELCNAKAEKEGYLNRTGQKIEEQVAQQVKQNTFAGTFNGEGTPIILQVQDENGTPLYVVGGNISADEQGVLSSDGLVVLRDGQGNFIQRPNMQGLTLAGTYSVEDYSNSLLAQTQEAVTAQIQSTESQEQQTEEQPTEEQKPETQQPQEQKPTIPVDKDGKKLYTQAPVEDTIADITSELGGDMDSVQSVVRTSAENANARLKAAQEKKKKGIKGKDPQEMIANANKLNQEIADAQAEADYWSNALNQIAPQQQAAEEPVSQEQPVEETTEEKPVEEQPQPIDETTVPVEQRAADMYGKLEDEEVRENLYTKISELNKQLSKLPKKPKMVADENAYLQEKEKLNAQRQELQKKLDYWTAVKDYIQQKTKTTPEDIKAAQDELTGTNARLDFAKQTEQGATTPIEIAGEFVKNAKIVPSDFYAETGMQAADARKQFPGMLSNNGVTIASLAEQLVQHDNDSYGGRFFKGDDMEARNAIIQALTGAESRKALGRDVTAEEQEYARVREQQREDFYQEAYGMSYSDYLAFEEQEMPNIWRRISNFAPEQYDQMVAEYYESLPEDYFTPQNEQQNGTERQQDNGLADSTTVLPQPPTDNKAGSGQRQDPAAETGTGSEDDNKNEEVSGGTQGTIGLPVALSYLLEGGRGSILSTDYFLHGVAAAFPKCSAAIENLIQKYRDEISDKPAEFAASNHKIIDEIRSEVYNSYGDKGIDILKTLFSQPTGFYPKESKDVARKIEELQEDTQVVGQNNEPQKKNSISGNTTDTDETVNNGNLNDTATQQDTVSESKDTAKSPSSQENQQKTDKKSDEGQQEDKIAAEIKKDIEDFIAKSTHDVEITNYDEENYDAQISVDGKPSNIVVTQPMEMEEGMHAEYRPENSSYQELGDLLDEYNKTVDRKDQGLDGEHLAAIFSSVDAAINFEKWLNQKKQQPEQASPLSTQAKRLLDAIEKEDLTEMAAAKKEITSIINGMSHAELSDYAYNKTQLLKQQDTGAKKEVYRYICNEAKKRADFLIEELNRKLQDKYPGVKVVYDSGSFWITASKDSEYKRGIDSLDNDRRWLNENSIDSSSVPSLHENSMNDWIKAVETRLSEIEPEKPWDEMNDNEKLEYVFSQPLLTEEEIKNAPSDEVNKANALAFINGQQGKINSISYFKVYTDVKHGARSGSADNEADNTAQLDETNSGSSRGRRAERKHSGLRNRRVDTEGGGQQDPNQDGQQLQRGENGEGRPSDNAGETGDMEVPGDQQSVGRRNPGDSQSGRGSVSDGDGHNVSQQGGNGRSRKNPNTDRRGSDKTDRGRASRNSELDSQDIDSQLQKEIDTFKSLLSDYRETKNKKSGNIYATVLPGLTINTEKIEAWGRLIYQGAKVGYLILRKGHTSLSEWSRIMKDMLTPAMHEIEVSDLEIDEFIKEMWHCNLPIGDEIHTIAEWSKIMQEGKLRSAIKQTLEEKRKKQLEAEPIEVKIADKNNIAETLPYLLPLQHDDVYKAEMQFFDESHNDDEHANGKGFMFTNGTGTGKTYTGLGIAKRFIKQGKKRILILTPSTTKVKDWVLDAANLNIEAYNLDDWAKAHGATATTSKGEGLVVTTYANFRQNQALLEDEFDLVIYDESHRLLENKKGGETEGSKQHYMLTNKDENWAFNRLQLVNPIYQAIQSTRREFDAQYDKEKAQFQDAQEAKFMLPNLSSPIAEFAGYPKLKEIRQKYYDLVKQFNDEVKPQLEEQAKESVKKTKVVFLSATPFNTRENLAYAEGYIFRYPKTYTRIGPRSQFYLDNFGAAYRWRNNRLEARTTNPEAVTRQEIAFSDYLQNQLGTMSGRVIDSEFDYSRDFPTVTFEKAEELNNAFEEIKKMEGNIMRKAFYEVMYNYQYTSVLFEAMKTSCIIPRMREHLNAGRKIVLFHRRMETANPITPPFHEMLNKANALVGLLTNTKEKNEAKAQIADFEQRFASMLEWEQTIDLRVPRVQILEAFGEEQVLLFSGKETTKQKNAAVDEFNSDASKTKIIVIQEASGKEGISLHDKTGKNQRVLISLAMPQSPITALQVEGRIYRIGNKSNAIFEYPLLGLDEELITWGQRFNTQVGTTENLALGSKARNLRESFAKAVIEHSGDVPLESQGVGGKEMDEAISQDQTDPFDKSVLDFYSNAKTSGRRDNREGKDYYPTPEPLGFMMVQWANLSEGESALEPSAGHGAIARYVPASNQLTSVEPSTTLFGRLQVLAGGIGRKFENNIFENYNIVNKHDVVLMNPPFGTAGRLAIDHVAKAFKHLSEGGRIVAIIPRGSADAKFDKWIETEKTAAVVGEIQLPNITFQNAGTQVACRVVIIDKISNEQMRNEALNNAKQIELPNNYAKIEDFFEDLRGITMPARTIDQKSKNDKKLMPIIKELKDEDNGFVVEFTPTGVLLSGVGFDYISMPDDIFKLNMAAQYARANKQIQYIPKRMTRVISAYEAIKKMALKLADMSEEEMNDFVAKNIKNGAPKKSIAEQFKYEVKKNTRTGEDMYVVSKNSGVVLSEDEYNAARSSAKANGGYWSRYAGGFIFPSEVAAKTFLGGDYINSDENETAQNNNFGTKYSEDNTINEQDKRSLIEKGYTDEQLKSLPYSSYTRRDGKRIIGLSEYIKLLENEKENLNLDNKDSAIRSVPASVENSTQTKGTEMGSSRVLPGRLVERLEAAKAESNRRIAAAAELRQKYNIDENGNISADDLLRMFEDFTDNKDDIELLKSIMDNTSNLNIDFKFNYKLSSAKGAASAVNKTVEFNMDSFSRDVPSSQKASTILHEMIHQQTQIAIGLYNTPATRIFLSPNQLKSMVELEKIFKAVQKAAPLNENGMLVYGATDMFEMVAELANPDFRKTLDSIKYDSRSILQKIIDWFKSFFVPVEKNNTSALDGARKSLDSLIRSYNPTVDNIARNVIRKIANNQDTLFSEITDDTLLDKLNSEPTVKVYRAMQVIDGKLYPPMAAKVGGSLVEPTKIGTWYQADEHPELIIQDGTYKDGTPKYKFKLDKGGNDATGKKATDVAAAYNPYWHTSRSPINDQFKSAWIRPNLVTVEVEVPESELTSGYKAQYAKNSVGEVDWKSGSVSGQLAKLGNPRKVILSRYNRVVRVVPVDEVADKFKEMLDGTGIEVPENTVTPQLRAALEAKGVKIGAPEKGVNKNAQIEEALAKGLETDNTIRNRKVEDSMQPRQTSQKQQQRMRAKAESLAKSLNVPVKIITVDEAPNDAKDSKGYYNTRTGKVVIVLDNNSSILDIEQTIAHEVIGHKGLRGLLGRANYYKLLNTIYDNLSEEDKKAIDEAARQNGWQLYTAIDEYLADQAEKMAWDARSATLWQNIVHYLTEALRNLGFIFKPNYKDARYWLWLSKNNLKRSDVMSNIRRNALLAKLDKLSRPEPTVKKDDVLGEPKYLHRDGNYVDSAAYDAIEENLRKKAFYWKEAFFDYMQAYQVFQEEMAKGLKNGLMDNQNALLGENALTSAIEQQQSDFLRLQLRPLQNLIKSLQNEFGSGREGIRNIENYLIMKHGLERNRVLFMRDWYKKESERKIKSSGELSPEAEYIYEKMERAIWQEFDDGNIDEKERDKQLLIALNDAHQQYLSNVMSEFNRIKNDELEYYDYEVKSLAEAYQAIDDFINQHTTFDPNKHDMSGLTALNEYFSGNKYEDDKIIAEVESLDQKIGFDTAQELMDAVQTVSQFALDQDYKNGLVTKESYNRAKNMFRYYVPLRGFDDTTMEDVYGYMTYSKGTGSKSLVHANGRFSKAGSPLATASNMALNAIARGLRNQNKQRAYRLVNTWLKDNPEAKAPAIVTDLWVGLDNNGNDIVHTPNITDDMSAEEIRDEIDRFNEEMKFLESLGKASKVKSEASFRHRFSSDNHKYEHIVPLMINGKAKMIVFNGNPRPAQALRGDLQPTVNKEFGMDRIMGQFNRIMAGAFTSYNPTFMMTNLLRDTGFANNTIAVKEGLEYWGKFTNNQRKLLTKDFGSYAKLKWNYDKGIAPRNKMEQYFYEFMRNGGKTGFVNQQDIAKLEKMLGAYNKHLSIPGQTIKVINALPQAIKAANERIENINRFAAYVTSRETGRSVMRSIYDAKEVSVNFNRKGAAGNTGNTPNATFNMKLAANLASFAKNSYLFFNAGIQSLNMLSKNFRDHKVKLATYAVGIPILLGGLILPFLNQILAESFGDGDDDPYANLPEWTRRNNFCFYLGGGRFLKIPLPIELRAFYGLGDIAAGYLINDNLKSQKNVALDMASQLSQILPVDFLGEGGSVTAAFTPDALKPMMQIATNTDWTGKPIYKDSEWNKYEPEYTKAFKGEFEPFVNLSKWINEVSGGSDHVKGSFDGSWNNPAIWHAVIQGYGGGAVMDAVRLGNLGKRVATGDFKNFSTKEIPIIKAIFDTPSEKTQYYRMLNKFYNYRDEADKFEHDLKAYRESASPLDHAKYLNYTNPAKPSPELRRLGIMKAYKADESRINKALKNPNLSEAERESLQEIGTKLKVETVKLLDQIE